MLAVLAALACAPKDREIRLERLAAERRALDRTFDHLEERLVVNQARVRFWDEMRERRESESVIAWAVPDERAEERAAHVPSPERSALTRARIATAPRAPASVERISGASGAAE